MDRTRVVAFDLIIPQRIIEKQSTAVDGVSGATNSIHVIMNAVQKSIQKASSIMKSIDSIELTARQRQALTELRERLFADFGISALILYGSVARGEADEESDIDLLVVTQHPLSRASRHQITDAVFEINLRHDTNFSTLVVDRQSWTTGPLSILPLHDEVIEEGVVL